MTINLIADDSYSSDLDMFSGGKALAVLAGRGMVNLLGLAVSSSNQYAPGGWDGAMRQCGVSGFEVGCYKGTFDPNSSTIPQSFYGSYPRQIGLASTVQDATTMYRTLLAARSRRDVTIVCLGFLVNLSALLNSPADGISTLTGTQLVQQAVKELIVVGGYWPNSANSAASPWGHTAGAPEWNFTQAPSEANDVLANWPGLVTLADTGIGDNVMMTKPSGLTANDPAWYAYDLAGQTQRAGWCEVGYLIAAGYSGIAAYHRGTGSVDASTGASTFTFSAAGPHRYASCAQTYATIQGIAQELIDIDTSQSPSAWASSALSQVALL